MDNMDSSYMHKGWFHGGYKEIIFLEKMQITTPLG